MSELKITVAGATGSGKTTVARLIKEALGGHRIYADVEDDHVPQYRGIENVMHKRRVEAIRDKARVTIKTENTGAPFSRGPV